MSESETTAAALVAIVLITIGGSGGGGPDPASWWREPGKCFAVVDGKIIGPWPMAADGVCRMEEMPHE